MLKRKQPHDITPFKGKRAGAAIYWGKTSFHFEWCWEGQGARRKWSCLWNRRSQCWVKNRPDFPSNVDFIMPTSVLPISRWGGNWSVRPLGALRVYDFSCCCHCPGFVLLCEVRISSKADSWSGTHSAHIEKSNNKEIMTDGQAVADRFASLKNGRERAICFHKWPQENFLHLNLTQRGFEGMLWKNPKGFDLFFNKWNKLTTCYTDKKTFCTSEELWLNFKENSKFIRK